MNQFDDILSWMSLDTVDIENECQRIQDEVYLFAKEQIFTESPGFLVFVGRKASHLLDKGLFLLEKGFQISQFKMIQKKFTHIKPTFQKGSEIILFGDTIHTGTEMLNVILTVLDQKAKIKKIVTYIINSTGFDEILKTHLVTEDQIVGKLETDNEIQYQEVSTPLQLFFRSRITPMDPDIPYYEYSTSDIVDPEIIKNVITQLLIDKIDEDIIFERTIERGLKNDVVEFKCTIDDGNKLNKIKRELFTNQKFITINGANILMKIHLKEKDINFTVWVDLDLDVNKSLCEKNEKNFHKSIDCQFHHLTSNLPDEINKNILCPYCVQEYISNNILEYIDENIDGLKIQENNIITLVYP